MRMRLNGTWVTRTVVAAGVAAIIVGVTTPARAQDRQFNLSAPGARANGMGQAFIGVADDATAAITNPAGLILLTRPQGYVEFKTSNTLTEDEIFGDKTVSPGDLSFFGVSAPIGSQFSAAFSVHKFFGSKVEFEGGSFEDQGYAYVGSFAVRVMEGLSLGVSIGSYSVSSDDDFLNETIGLDAVVGFTVGGLYRVNEMISVGASGFFASETTDDLLGEKVAIVPDRFGFGVGVRPVPRALITSDVVWVGYENTFNIGEDATEFHIGGEYQVAASGTNLFFARAGFFTSSADVIEDFEGFDVDGKNVGTFGVGWVMGRRLQVDFAYLTHGEAVVSAAVRF